MVQNIKLVKKVEELAQRKVSSRLKLSATELQGVMTSRTKPSRFPLNDRQSLSRAGMHQWPAGVGMGPGAGR